MRCVDATGLLRFKSEQFLNEVLCILCDLVKYLVIEIILTRGNIEESLLVCVSLEW